MVISPCDCSCFWYKNPMAKRKGHVNTLLFFRGLGRVSCPAEVGIFSSPPLPWRTCSPQAAKQPPPQLGHRAGCTGFLPLRNIFLKGYLALTLTNMNAVGRRPHASPGTVSQHRESSLLRSPVMNATKFCPTATGKLGRGSKADPGVCIWAHMALKSPCQCLPGCMVAVQAWFHCQQSHRVGTCSPRAKNDSVKKSSATPGLQHWAAQDKSSEPSWLHPFLPPKATYLPDWQPFNFNNFHKIKCFFCKISLFRHALFFARANSKPEQPCWCALGYEPQFLPHFLHCSEINLLYLWINATDDCTALPTWVHFASAPRAGWYHSRETLKNLQ